MNGSTLNHNFSNQKTNLIIVIVSILLIIMLAILGIIISRKYVVKQAEARIQGVLLEAEALHHYVQKEMHPAMYQLKADNKLPKEFYSPDLLSSSFITRHIFNQYNYIRNLNQLPTVEYRLASKNPRNTINLADSLEVRLIDMFNADSTIQKYTGIITDNGIKQLYYAKPFLRITNECLVCHGKKENAPKELTKYYNWNSGFDWKVNEIPAIEIIKTPLVTEFKTSSNIAILILMIAGVLLILIVLYSRLSNKNKIINHQKEEIRISLNELKKAQAQLVQSEKMASLGVLTAGVAHEINNPLNFINGAYLGLNSFFSSSLPEHQQKVAVLLKALRTGIDRTSEIVQGLNHFSRDSKEYNEECDIHTIMDNCLLILKSKYSNNISIEKDYNSHRLLTKGNEGKLHQAFINILLNAVQAIDKNGIINIKTEKQEDTIVILISDNGCGINLEHISQIFDPFFTTKDPGKGIGLGLSISYNIIKEHQGTIEFTSELNKGTIATITFPITY
ncbi:c-type heme family protein [Marinifilum sp. RC60d5]|uniref:c-type heme family protein n=1 Tax=Marinifilum sp. RC60d5 TaxID=3458414 RepID=UPI0040352745